MSTDIDLLVHWIGERNNTLHGNGYGSRDMENASGDEDEVTCSLCHSLLAKRARELADEPAEVAHHYAQDSDEGNAYSRGWHNGYDAGWDAAKRSEATR